MVIRCSKCRKDLTARGIWNSCSIDTGCWESVLQFSRKNRFVFYFTGFPVRSKEFPLGRSLEKGRI